MITRLQQIELEKILKKQKEEEQKYKLQILQEIQQKVLAEPISGPRAEQKAGLRLGPRTSIRAPKAGLRVEPKAVSKPKAGSRVEPKAGLRVEPKAVSKSKAGQRAEPNAVSKPKAGQRAEPNAGPRVEPKAVPITVPKASPIASPISVPKASPISSPIAVPKAEPKVSLIAVPKAKAGPRVVLSFAPKSVPKPEIPPEILHQTYKEYSLLENEITKHNNDILNNEYLSNIEIKNYDNIKNFLYDDISDIHNKIFIEDLITSQNKRCHILLNYIDKILLNNPNKSIVKLSNLTDEEYEMITKLKQINSGTYGKIYDSGNDTIIKKNKIKNPEEIINTVIILNLENLNNLIPKIHELHYYYNIETKKLFFYIKMDKYKDDLYKYFYYNNPSINNSNIIKEQLIKLLFRLYKNNLICADIKLENIVINYEKQIDVKLIDIELDFCNCIEDDIMNNKKAIIFVQYYLYFLNIRTKNKLLRLPNIFDYYDIVYEFLNTFEEYFNAYNHYLPTTPINLQKLNKIKFYSSEYQKIDIKTFMSYNIEEKISYLKLSRKSVSILKKHGEIYFYKNLYCIFFIKIFKYTTPLRYYILQHSKSLNVE